jgi:hypothetical protein
METSYFLAHSSKKMINYWNDEKRKHFSYENDDGRVNFIYYLFKEKAWDLIIHIPSKNIKIRKSKLYYIIDHTSSDLNKIEDSVRANWIHYIDALLIREINRKHPLAFITIHDCVLVDILNVSCFIENINWLNNQKIFKEIKWNEDNTLEFKSIFTFL